MMTMISTKGMVGFVCDLLVEYVPFLAAPGFKIGNSLSKEVIRVLIDAATTIAPAPNIAVRSPSSVAMPVLLLLSGWKSDRAGRKA